MARAEQSAAFEGAARALRAGEISDGEFVRRTARKWRATAHYIFARYRRKLPAWVEPSDVEQELVLFALKYVRAFEPGRTKGTIENFVNWCAIHRAQRVIDHWRGVSLHGPTNAPSRCEIAFTRAFAPDADPYRKLEPTEASQEVSAQAAQAIDSAVQRAETVREALVLLALKRSVATGEPAEVALFGNYGARVELRLRSTAHARRVLDEEVAALSARRGVDAQAGLEVLDGDGGAGDVDDGVRLPPHLAVDDGDEVVREYDALEGAA